MVLHEPAERPDPKPVESMQQCDEELSKLSEDVVDMPVEEALKSVLKAREEDRAKYSTCKLRQEDLTRWIRKQ